MEVFAPTSHSPAIRLILTIAAIEDLHLHSVDISHAFINDKLIEEIYMQLPHGSISIPRMVCGSLFLSMLTTSPLPPSHFQPFSLAFRNHPSTLNFEI
jgi:hypothetical protein